MLLCALGSTPLGVDTAAADSRGRSRTSLLYLLGALIQGFGLVAVQPFTLQVLSDVEWGKLSVAISTLQVGVVVAAAGLPLAITRAFFDAGDGQRKARSISGFLSATGLVLAAVAAVTYAAVQIARDNQIPWHNVLAIVTMGVLATVVGGQAVLRAQGRPLAFVGLSIGISLGANGLGLAAVTVLTPTATVYMLGYATAVFVAAAASLAVAPPRSPFAEKAAVVDALGIGLPILPHSAALLLLSQGGVLLLAATAGPTAAGDFAKVQIFALAPVTLLAALNNSWVPYLMSSSRENRGTRLASTMRQASAAAAGIAIVAACGAGLGTRILAPGNEDLVRLAQVLPLVGVGYVLYIMSTTMLFTQGRTRLMAVVTPLVVVAGAAVAYTPARAGDLMMVATVAVSTYLVLGLTYFFIARAIVSSDWAMRSFGLAALAAIGVALGVSLLPNTLPVAIVTGVGGLVAMAIGTRVHQVRGRR